MTQNTGKFSKRRDARETNRWDKEVDAGTATGKHIQCGNYIETIPTGKEKEFISAYGGFKVVMMQIKFLHATKGWRTMWK